MSSVECLREFVTERLSAAAEEIFGVFQKTIVDYEEEINRQRRLLDIFLKPEIKLHRIELPQQHVCKKEEEEEDLTVQQLCEEEISIKLHRIELPQQHVCNEEDLTVQQLCDEEKPSIKLHRIELPQQHVCNEEDLTDQQLCNEERSSSVDQEDPEPLQIKEEQEELCTSQQGEQLELKLETDSVMLTPTCEQHDHSQSMPNSDYQLLSYHFDVAESQEQKRAEHEDSGSTSNNGKELKILRHSHRFARKDFKCTLCPKAFMYKSKLDIHMRVHTGEKPFSCLICGTRFSQLSGLNAHMKFHKGERPYICQVCGKSYRFISELKAHMRKHPAVMFPQSTQMLLSSNCETYFFIH